MKMTKNRLLILQALTEDFDGLPPHSASFVHYTLKASIENNWEGEPYESMKTLPNIQQVHRTLRELWHGGYIVGTRIKRESYGNQGLPRWEVCYQLATDATRNGLLAEIDAVVSKVKKAKFGFNLFGAIFDKGLPESEVKLLATKVKALMQKTHPDKIAGFEEQFIQLKEAHGLIKSGIPLPTLTYQANAADAQVKAIA